MLESLQKFVKVKICQGTDMGETRKICQGEVLKDMPEICQGFPQKNSAT